MDSLKGLVDTVKVNKIMLESNHGQPAESPIAQRKSITNLPCYKGKVVYHKYYKVINISSKGQIRNGLVAGRLACISSKSLKIIAIKTLTQFNYNLECIFAQGN